jgi:signal transduction histidine kinase
MQANPSQERQRDLSTAAPSARDILIMEEERRRLARELHDGILQAIVAMSMHIEVCRQLSLSDDLAALQEELAELKLVFQKSITDIRDMMAEWRLPSSKADNLRELIGAYVCEYETRTGIEVSLDLKHLPEDGLQNEQIVAVFRILQEALRNASWHAEASQVWLEASTKRTSLRLSIEDDGKGFDLLRASSGYPRQGLGLVGMQERAKALGGTLHIDAEPGRGTKIVLIIPLRGSESQLVWSQTGGDRVVA